MMIIKQGDPNRTTRLVTFSCKICGCEFILGPHEYYEHRERYDAVCPCCHSACVADKI